MERLGQILAEVVERIFDVASGNESRPLATLDSPIETLLDYKLSKYVDDRARIFQQYPIRTQCGTRIIDFVIERDSVRIGIECDGRDFHVYERDLWRDAVILGTGEIDVIYRLSGSMITNHPDDCLFIIAYQSPLMFSDRGRLNLDRLASVEVKRAPTIRSGRCGVLYRDAETGMDRSEAVERRSLDLPSVFRRWTYARSSGERDLDKLVERFFAAERLRPNAR